MKHLFDEDCDDISKSLLGPKKYKDLLRSGDGPIKNKKNGRLLVLLAVSWIANVLLIWFW